MERFRNEIIPSVLERKHLVHVARTCGDENDRACCFLPKLPAPIIPVIRGQIDIKQDQMRVECYTLRLHIIEILNNRHIILIFAQCIRQQPSNFFIILNNEDTVIPHRKFPLRYSNYYIVKMEYTLGGPWGGKLENGLSTDSRRVITDSDDFTTDSQTSYHRLGDFITALNRYRWSLSPLHDSNLYHSTKEITHLPMCYT